MANKRNPSWAVYDPDESNSSTDNDGTTPSTHIVISIEDETPVSRKPRTRFITATITVLGVALIAGIIYLASAPYRPLVTRHDIVLQHDGGLYYLRTDDIAITSTGDVLMNYYAYRVADLYAISLGDFKIRSTDNPFYSGELSVHGSPCYDTKTFYDGPNPSGYMDTFYDKDGTTVWSYSYGGSQGHPWQKGGEFFQKGRSHSSRQQFFNMTQFLDQIYGVALTATKDTQYDIVILTIS